MKDEKGAAVAGYWPSTGQAFRWLQVWPFRAFRVAKSVPGLRARIAAAEGAAPELDAVGFVPGAPRCHGTLLAASPQGLEPWNPKHTPRFQGICRTLAEQLVLGWGKSGP